MTNYVPLNNTILHDIVRCFNSQYWSRFMQSPNKKIGLVFHKKTVFRVIINVTKNGNN